VGTAPGDGGGDHEGARHSARPPSIAINAAEAGGSPSPTDAIDSTRSAADGPELIDVRHALVGRGSPTTSATSSCVPPVSTDGVLGSAITRRRRSARSSYRGGPHRWCQYPRLTTAEAEATIDSNDVDRRAPPAPFPAMTIGRRRRPVAASTTSGSLLSTIGPPPRERPPTWGYRTQPFPARSSERPDGFPLGAMPSPARGPRVPKPSASTTEAPARMVAPRARHRSCPAKALARPPAVRRRPSTEMPRSPASRQKRGGRPVSTPQETSTGVAVHDEA